MDKKEKKNLLVFGYGLSVLIPLFVLLHGRKHGIGPISTVLLCAAVVILGITVFRLEWLRSFYKYWMKVAHFIGDVISTVVLSLLFYGVFTPMGIVLRLMGKDYLDRKLDATSKSYWTKREQTKFNRKSYHQQF